MRTVYPFTLPRGYLGPDGTVHRDGEMRLATGRDELEPLRDPFVKGPDDPRLTMLVLARVVQRLGVIEHVTLHEIEGLFAADLAFLQDFYSVVNFGDQAEYEALLCSAGQPRPDLVVSGSLSLSGSSSGSPVATGTTAGAGSGDPVPAVPGPPEEVCLTGEPRDEFAARSGRVLASPTRRDAILEVAATGGPGPNRLQA